MALPAMFSKNNSDDVYVQPTPSSCSDIVIVTPSPSLKRIMQEAREPANDSSTEYSAAPLEVCITYLSPTRRLMPLLPSLAVTLGRYCIVFLRNVSLSPMWTIGVTLHTARRSGTDFEFRIWLPAEYPSRPPSIMLFAPNDRFELNMNVGSLDLFLSGSLTLHLISFTNCEGLALGRREMEGSGTCEGCTSQLAGSWCAHENQN